MPIELTPEDMIVVGKIQEARNLTIARAKEYYRAKVNKLANRDLPNRSEIVWEGYQRMNKAGSTVKDPPEPREEKEETEVKKTPRAKKEKTEKKPKAEKKVSRMEVPLPELAEQIVLKPTDQPHVFTARGAAVVRAEVDHKEVSDRFGYVGVSERKLKLAKSHAKEHGLKVAIACVVRVKGRVDQGYFVPLEVFEKFVMKSKHAMTLGAEARLAYQASGVAGVKFSEEKPATAAA